MNRLWLRLTLSFLAITVVGTGVVALLTDWQAGQQFQQYVTRQTLLTQSGLVDELAAFYQRTGSWNGVAEIMAAFTGPGGHGAGMGRGRPVFLLADQNGAIVYDERSMPMMSQALTAEELRSALPIEVEGQTVGYLLVSGTGRGMMGTGEEAFLNQLRQTLGIAALAAGALSLLLGLLISRAVASPLTRLAQTARAFGRRQWNQRAPVGGTQEVAEVAHAFNDMADALQQSETQRRNLIADIAHELRTPLSVLQGNLQALLDGVYPLERGEIATLYDETRLLSRLVDDLRELALAEAGQLPLNLEMLDPLELAQTVIANFSMAAEAKSVELKLESGAWQGEVQADADRVRQVLVNLLSNALRHTPENGQICVRLDPQAYGVCVSVQDTGAGIAPDDLPHVFDRFYRGDQARPRLDESGGTGLGLAIAKAWVQAMGGQIGVESSVGQGSRFWFTLPSLRPPQVVG